nr:hypothetical protein [Arthrobacter sp. KBS0703]
MSRKAARTRSRLPGAGVCAVTSATDQVIRPVTPSAKARSRPMARASVEKSMARTCQPRPASQTAWRPSPDPRSRARPGASPLSAERTDELAGAQP